MSISKRFPIYTRHIIQTNINIFIIILHLVTVHLHVTNYITERAHEKLPLGPNLWLSLYCI